MTSPHRWVAILIGCLFAAGCRQDMHDAPRYEVYEASTTFADGRASRAAPTGTVARGWLREDDALYTGKVNGELVDSVPFAVSARSGRARTDRVGSADSSGSTSPSGSSRVVTRWARPSTLNVRPYAALTSGTYTKRANEGGTM